MLFRSPFLEWMYVPTDMNPADCTKRPLRVEDAVAGSDRVQLWFRSPSFLQERDIKWPEQKLGIEHPDDVQAEELVVQAIVQGDEEGNEESVSDLVSRFPEHRCGGRGCRGHNNEWAIA